MHEWKDRQATELRVDATTLRVRGADSCSDKARSTAATGLVPCYLVALEAEGRLLETPVQRLPVEVEDAHAQEADPDIRLACLQYVRYCMQV